MRLLLRANTHRRTDDGCIEVAASPDTPHRERWQWHLRLLDIEPGSGTPNEGVTIVGADGRQRLLRVSTDVATTQAEVEVHEVQQPLTIKIKRPSTDLLVLLVHRGEALVEGRHRLAELDALVLEGDDPLEVSVEPMTAPVGISVVRLGSTSERPLAWVP